MSCKAYIVCSHVDWTKKPFGKVFHYPVFTSTGLQCGQHVGDHASAQQYAEEHGLTWLSPAKLGKLWSQHWTSPFERIRAEKKLLERTSDG